MSAKALVIRTIYAVAIFGSILVMMGIVLLLQSKSYIFSSAGTTTTNNLPEPFPVSVNIYTQVIEEDPTVTQYFYNTLANEPNSKNNWWNQVAAVFAKRNWYQNLASPVSRIIVIWPGERKEEIAKNIGDVLRWDKAEKQEFTDLIDASDPKMIEGKYFPGQYVAHREATPSDIKNLIETNFRLQVLKRYTPSVDAQVPLEDALIIASLLEREASDFYNMREVSGVIWNRLFIDMPLQLDATLQYVRGSNPAEPKWWPAVKPRDKYLDSPYNTYQNEGLPPTPIANPSAEAILAALNPIETSCLYYFHTEDKQYHCSDDYEDHVQKLRNIYGRGR